MGGGGGGRFSISTYNQVRWGSKAPTLGRKEILLLGVHFTADKNDDHLLTGGNLTRSCAASLFGFSYRAEQINGFTFLMRHPWPFFTDMLW